MSDSDFIRGKRIELYPIENSTTTTESSGGIGSFFIFLFFVTFSAIFYIYYPYFKSLIFTDYYKFSFAPNSTYNYAVKNLDKNISKIDFVLNVKPSKYNHMERATYTMYYKVGRKKFIDKVNNYPMRYYNFDRDAKLLSIKFHFDRAKKKATFVSEYSEGVVYNYYILRVNSLNLQHIVADLEYLYETERDDIKNYSNPKDTGIIHMDYIFQLNKLNTYPNYYNRINKNTFLYKIKTKIQDYIIDLF